MDYKIDADRKGFHVWLSAAEFAKVQGDARRVGVPLDEYLQEIMLWGVSQAVKMGLQAREGESHLVVTANRREWGGVSLIAQLRGWRAIMDVLVKRVDVWAATIEDRPAGLAQALATLRDAGADLQFIIARRAESGKGVLFVTPLQGDGEIAAAAQVGFNVTNTLHSVRVMGRDRPGIAAELTQKLAEERINLRGFSGSVIGTQFLAYVALDSREDANKVIEILEKG
jgi:hypothetical protein